MGAPRLNFARSHGVTLIAAEGNENTNLDHPTYDGTSPDFPPGAAKHRYIDHSCLSEPSEAQGVIAVSSVGPINTTTGSPYPRKAYYSNYGLEQTDVSAPGGDRREFFGTPQFNAPENRILAPYPLNVAVANCQVDANGIPDGTNFSGAPTFPPIVRNCANGTCALYQWLQGTSMAAPHAVGVAAIIVAERGRHDRCNGGLTLNPNKTERVLRRTATDTPCPVPNLFHYPDPDLDASFDALCEGTPAVNGFYGDGIVNALAASRSGRKGWFWNNH
jgi:subtilisin family serine protease